MSGFRNILDSGKVVIFDGGMGTLLQDRGLGPGQSPELFGLQNPQAVMEVHKDYIRAGARIITTNTFGGSPAKLGNQADALELNRSMARAAREAAGDAALVAGSVGPTGKFVKPLGDHDFQDLVDEFKRQITGLCEGGADLILAETHFDLAEVRAVVVAARNVCDLPVAVSMTFEDGVSLTGTTPEVFAATMQNMGVDMIGTNCSAGPEGMLPVVKRLLSVSEIPVFASPNAGLPVLEDGRTVFKLGPGPYAEQTARMAALGVRILGGCCGTTPEHITALAQAAEKAYRQPESGPSVGLVRLTSRQNLVAIGPGNPAVLIGERINPTGKEKLTSELQSGTLSEALRLAEEQVAAGAGVLDVNVGAPMVEEKKVLPRLVLELAARQQAPLSLDTSDSEAVRAALDVYPGSALVNSISGEAGRMELLGPLCRDLGAPFILLPLEGKKLPVTAKQRIRVIESLLAKAEDLGIPRRLILVDVLVLTVSSNPESAKACLETIDYCVKNGLPTLAGLSNISFGLPARELINSVFLGMALSHGLSAFIANPASVRLCEVLAASEVLLARDARAHDFITGYSDWKPGTGGAGAGTAKPGPDQGPPTLKNAVIHGQKDEILELIEGALKQGADPFALVNDELIPGITEVGDRYERKQYFLPQLIRSAETMQAAFDRLKPHLEKGKPKAAAKVVMATVEGDIHDIGKNIVCLMLKNHGFTVIDLGVDVPAEKIVAAAEEHGAALIGLSALMTTTMTNMEKTVTLARERGVSARIMVGGAVLSAEFAERIGAHGYAPDAVSAVKTAKRLVEQKARA